MGLEKSAEDHVIGERHRRVAFPKTVAFRVRSGIPFDVSDDGRPRHPPLRTRRHKSPDKVAGMPDDIRTPVVIGLVPVFRLHPAHSVHIDIPEPSIGFNRHSGERPHGVVVMPGPEIAVPDGPVLPFPDNKNIGVDAVTFETQSDRPPDVVLRKRSDRMDETGIQPEDEILYPLTEIPRSGVDGNNRKTIRSEMEIRHHFPGILTHTLDFVHRKSDGADPCPGGNICLRASRDDVSGITVSPPQLPPDPIHLGSHGRFPIPFSMSALPRMIP